MGLKERKVIGSITMILIDSWIWMFGQQKGSKSVALLEEVGMSLGTGFGVSIAQAWLSGFFFFLLPEDLDVEF